MSNFKFQIKIFLDRKFQLFIIVLLTILVYAPIFFNGFVIDDFDFIVNWQDTRSLTNIPKFFLGSVPSGHQGVYRPLRSVFYALSYKLWGLSTFGYHFQALFVHLACTVLVYLITFELIKSLESSIMYHVSSIKKNGKYILHNTYYILPLTASLLFGLHPIHTEAITYIAASMEMTGVIFFFSAFYFYLKGSREMREIGEMKGKKKQKYILHNTYYILLSYAFSIGAFFTYEMTLTLPLLLLLYELTLGRPRKSPSSSMYQALPAGRQVSSIKQKQKYILHTTYYIILGYFLLAGIYGFIRVVFAHTFVRGQYFGGSMYYTFLVMSKAFVKYLELIVFPFHLSLVHVLPGGIGTLGEADLSKALLSKQSLWEVWVLLGIFGIVGLLGVAILLIKKFPLISFCILWFLIALLPASQIIPLQVVMGEKYLYIPSFGWTLLTAMILLRVSNGLKVSKVPKGDFPLIPLILLFPLILFYGYLTFMRNLDWKSSEAVWKSATITDPGSVSAHYNLGTIYQNQGNLDTALPEFQKALVIDPQYTVVLNNIGFTYIQLGKLDLAEASFKKALLQNKDFYPMHFGLGVLYQKKGEFAKAKEEYEKALKNNPGLDQARQALNAIAELSSYDRFSDSNITFLFPKNWKVQDTGSEIVINDANKSITISIKIDKSNHTFEVFVSDPQSPFIKEVDRIVSTIKLQ